MFIQLMDYEKEMGEEARFVVHADDTEDQTVEMMRQCFRSMRKRLEERRALAESRTVENILQAQKFLH